VDRRLAAHGQGHARAAPGDQGGGQVGGPGQDGVGGLGGGLVAGPGHARGLAGLAAVGLDQGRAVVAGKVAALGIDDHRLAGGVGGGDGGLQHHGGQHALGVVGQHHHVDLAQVGVERRQQGLAVGLAPVLAVGAQHLVRAGDIAGLFGGAAAGVDDQRRVEAGLAVDQAGQHPAGVVVADHADQHRPAAQGRDVAGHVAGPAQHHRLALDGDHRHRRLGRDAVDRPIDEAVQHHVAQHQHGGAGKGSRQLGQGVVHRIGRSKRRKKRHLAPRAVRRKLFARARALRTTR
jgi:hypothetical protein